MRISIVSGLLAATLASAASWGFDDASLQVLENRGSEVSSKKIFTPEIGLKDSISIRSTGLLRLALTATNGGKPRRPHQAFVTISSDSGLEESFPLTINDGGKAKLDIKYTDIPTALTSSKKPLQVSIVIGSFGSSKALKANAFSFSIAASTTTPTTAAPAAARYSALPEIHHIFRDDPKNPPKILSLIFTIAVVAALPGLFITWAGLGGNLNHFGKAFGTAPISHALFFGSILGMEFAFWQYYTNWKLYTLLPVAGVIGLVAIVSGSRALTEVQQRRLLGER